MIVFHPGSPGRYWRLVEWHPAWPGWAVLRPVRRVRIWPFTFFVRIRNAADMLIDVYDFIPLEGAPR